VVILGVRNPLSVAVKSKIELLAGVAVPIPTCAFEEYAQSNSANVHKDIFKLNFFITKILFR
jgi:hypothetical protein